MKSVVPDMAESPVRELRVAVTVEDYEEALRFYRDVLGLRRGEALRPVVTPWSHRDVRLQAPDGMQLTLFTVLED